MRKSIYISTLLAVTLGVLASSACREKNEPTPDPNKGKEIEKVDPKSTPNPEKPDPKGTDPKNPDGDKPKNPDNQPPNPKDPSQNSPQKGSNRPQDEELARRLMIAWKSTDNSELFKLDLDKLILNKDASGLTLATFTPFLSVSSIGKDGQTTYTLTAEELAKLSMKKLEYQDGLLIFTLYYGQYFVGTRNVALKKNEYFQSKVQVNSAAMKDYYMQGVARLFDIWKGEALSYDTSKYAVEVNSGNIQTDAQSNNLRVELTLNTLGQEDRIAIFTKVISGFRPLQDIQSELIISPTYQLIERMKKQNGKDLVDTKKLLENTIRSWVKELGFSLRDGATLSWEENKNALLGGNSAEQRADVYLSNPVFELVEVRNEGGAYTLKIRFSGANDVVFSQPKTYEVVVKV